MKFSLHGMSIKDIDLFIEQANTFHPTIKFAVEILEKEIIFLDTVVYKGERFLKEAFLDVWKLTTSRPRPFNIHTIPLASHQALRETLLKEKQSDFLEQNPRKKIFGRPCVTSKHDLKHVVTQKT